MNGKNLKKWGLLCLLMMFAAAMYGANDRTTPIDVYIIVDSSAAMEKGKTEAADWLCTAVIDGKLLQSDRIWIYTAGAEPELVYSGTLSDRDAAKTALRSIRYEGNAADYRGALQEARTQAEKSDRTSYTLLVSGSGAKDPPSQEAESAGLLRYSRVDSFSGWRVLTVGFDIGPKARRASAYYRDHR